MDLFWAWLAAIVAHFLAGAAATFAVGRLVLMGPEAAYSEWILLLSIVVVAVVQASAAAAGVLAHRPPHRDRLGRNALAALGVPLVWLLSRLLLDAGEPEAGWLVSVLTVSVGVCGAVAGWLPTRWLVNRRARRRGSRAGSEGLAAAEGPAG